MEGLEPPTLSLEHSCSVQLSYTGPMLCMSLEVPKYFGTKWDSGSRRGKLSVFYHEAARITLGDCIIFIRKVIGCEVKVFLACFPFPDQIVFWFLVIVLSQHFLAGYIKSIFYIYTKLVCQSADSEE